MNNTLRNNVSQADREAIRDSEYHYQREKGTEPAFAVSRAWKAVGQAESAANRPDESRLKGSFLKLEASADRQTRGGEIADFDTTLRALETMASMAAASGSHAHKDRIQAAFDALANKGKPNAGRRKARMLELRTLRKSLGVLIEQLGLDDYKMFSVSAAEFLLTIEAELSYLGETRDGTMHFDNVVSMLPRHVEREGAEAIMVRFKTLLKRYGDMYTAAAVASVETGEFTLPRTITGRDIGIGYGLTVSDLKRYFPKGQHFIRGCDRDAVDADRRARGLKIRVKRKPLTRKEIRDRAQDQRDIEAMVEHYGYTRETVQRWRMSKPKPGSDLYGEKFLDILERMEAEKAAGIDPKADKDELPPELRAALMQHFDVTDAAIRQWKRRKQLDAKIAQYRRETALQVVA